MEASELQEAVTRFRNLIPIEEIRRGALDVEAFKRRYMLNKAIVEEARRMLDALGGVNINARDLMAAYLFAYYGFEDSLQECTLALLEQLHDGAGAFLPELRRRLLAYEEKYVAWKPQDRASLLHDMCRLYWEYELVFKLNEPHMTPEEKATYYEETTRRQTKLLKAMRGIDDMRMFAEFPAPVVFQEAVVEKIKTTLKKAFWNLIREDIAQRPANITRLLSVFVDIRQNLVQIAGEGHRMLEEFDDIMDPGFIAQIHTASGGSQEEFWTSRCGFLIDILARLDSPHMDGVHRTWWKELCESRSGYDKCVHCLAYFVDHLEGLVTLVQRVREAAPGAGTSTGKRT